MNFTKDPQLAYNTHTHTRSNDTHIHVCTQPSSWRMRHCQILLLECVCVAVFLICNTALVLNTGAISALFVCPYVRLSLVLVRVYYVCVLLFYWSWTGPDGTCGCFSHFLFYFLFTEKRNLRNVLNGAEGNHTYR